MEVKEEDTAVVEPPLGETGKGLGGMFFDASLPTCGGFMELMGDKLAGVEPPNGEVGPGLGSSSLDSSVDGCVGLKDSKGDEPCTGGISFDLSVADCIALASVGCFFD